MNEEQFLSRFTKVFVLKVDDATLTYRLRTREDTDFGKRPEDLRRQLEWNRGVEGYAKRTGAILIDATQSLDSVVGEILSYV